MALIANHLGEREGVKTGLQLSLSSLLKPSPLVSFRKGFVGFIFKSYSTGSQQIYSEMPAFISGLFDAKVQDGNVYFNS
jgi:hypothetical protein